MQKPGGRNYEYTQDAVIGLNRWLMGILLYFDFPAMAGAIRYFYRAKRGFYRVKAIFQAMPGLLSGW